MGDQKIVNIENWSIEESNENPLKAPELRSKALHGNVYNHSNFEDGQPILSSSIREIDLVKGRVVTKNTVYKLGKINKDYLVYCKENNIKDLELLKKYKEESEVMQ